MNVPIRTLVGLAVAVCFGFWAGYGFAQYRWSSLWPEMMNSASMAEANLAIGYVELIDRGDIAQLRVNLLAGAKGRADMASRPAQPVEFSWSDLARGPLENWGSTLHLARDVTNPVISKVREAIARACVTPPPLDKYKFVCS
jgi:hypothetical protein